MDKIYEANRDPKRLIMVIFALPFVIGGIYGMVKLIQISYPYLIDFKRSDLFGLILAGIIFLMIAAFTWFISALCLSMTFNKTSLYYDKEQSNLEIHDFFIALYLLPKLVKYRFDLNQIQKIIRYEDIDNITLTHSFFVFSSDHIASFPSIVYTKVHKLKDFEIETVKSTEISVREFGKKYNLKDKWWRGSKSESLDYIS